MLFMNDIKCKRAYEAPAKDDGKRILVDRLWPRGLKKELASIDCWAKNMAPSTELRKWFAHDPNKFETFSSKYEAELEENPEAESFIENLRTILQKEPVSFIYAAKDTEHNHANVLKIWSDAKLNKLAK
jgi:uncharacterized protein YeaO (DUF488 family)